MVSEIHIPAAQRGKPRLTLDHISIAPAQRGGVSVCLTVTIQLDDVQTIDMIMKAIGTIARARGYGDQS